jgi:hypothetical protein
MLRMRLMATWLGPDVALAASFLLAWIMPDTFGAATEQDCRTVTILQGLSILAGVLVGGYRDTALVFLPIVLGGCALWLLATGMAGLSWAWISFVWYVIGSFLDGLRAHRGEFGLARENAEHPHRRYDRLVILYVGTAPVVVVLWLLDSSARWTIWGMIYFSLSAAVDTVLRDWFDRIPRGILRWMQKRVRDPQMEAQVGSCLDCVYVQPAIPCKPGRMIRCLLSVTDPKFPEYPATPIHVCDGFCRPAE